MKKFLAMLLTLVMLALPVLGLAESPAEMLESAVNAGRPLHASLQLSSGTIPGLDAESAAIINDLIDAIGFTLDQQEGDAPQFDFALQLSGTDVLTLAAATQGEETYVKSNLLGDATVAFNAAEGKVILDRLMELAVEAGMFTQDDVAAVKQAIEEASAQMSTQMQMSNMDVEDMDLTGLIAVVTELAAKAKVEAVTAQPKNCDTAATVLSISLTGEDIAKVYDAVFEMLKSNEAFMAGMSSMELTMDGEAVTPEEMMEKAPAAIREVMAMIQGEVPLSIYLNEAGEPVYGTASMTMKAEDENGAAQTLTMDVNYARLTVNEGITHTATLNGSEENGTGVAMTFNMLQSPAHSTANLAVDSVEGGVNTPVIQVAVDLEKEYGETEAEEEMEFAVTITDSDSGEEIGFRFEMESSAEKYSDVDVMYEAELELYIMDQEEEVFTIKVNEVTGTATDSIVAADAVRPGAMTDDEFTAFLNEDVMMALQNALVVAVQNLPASILQLMMQ